MSHFSSRCFYYLLFSWICSLSKSVFCTDVPHCFQNSQEDRTLRRIRRHCRKRVFCSLSILLLFCIIIVCAARVFIPRYRRGRRICANDTCMQATERAKKSEQAIIACSGVVGMTGFEPAASWSQTKRSTKLSHIPKYGTVLIIPCFEREVNAKFYFSFAKLLTFTEMIIILLIRAFPLHVARDKRVCWNWQTGTFEGRVSMTYGFKSRHSHHMRIWRNRQTR